MLPPGLIPFSRGILTGSIFFAFLLYIVRSIHLTLLFSHQNMFVSTAGVEIKRFKSNRSYIRAQIRKISSRIRRSVLWKGCFFSSRSTPQVFKDVDMAAVELESKELIGF